MVLHSSPVDRVIRHAGLDGLGYNPPMNAPARPSSLKPAALAPVGASPAAPPLSATGDGLVAALQVLAVVVTTGKPVSQVTNRFVPLPQLLENVRYAKGRPLEDIRVVKAIDAGKIKLGNTGRLVIRPSGTTAVASS